MKWYRIRSLALTKKTGSSPRANLLDPRGFREFCRTRAFRVIYPAWRVWRESRDDVKSLTIFQSPSNHMTERVVC